MKTIDDLLLCLYFDRSSDLFFEGLHPSGWTLAQHTTKTILRLAGLGHAILVGRGANVITARLPNVFHVRLVAPLLTRNRHAAEFYHLSEAEAAKLVREQDHARRRYVRRYFNSEIDDRDPLRRDAQHRSFGFCRCGRGHRAAGVAAPPRFCRTPTLMGMLLAALGHRNPVSGAISQEIIDFLAVLNTLRAAASSQDDSTTSRKSNEREHHETKIQNG